MEAPLGFLKKGNEAAKLSWDGQEVKLKCKSSPKKEPNVSYYSLVGYLQATTQD